MKTFATQPWRLFAVTPGLWTIHQDGEVLLRLSKHGPGHETPVTIPAFFRESVSRFGAYPALATKNSERWETLNFNQYYEACRKAARALIKVNESFAHSFIIQSFILQTRTYGIKCTRYHKTWSLTGEIFSLWPLTHPLWRQPPLPVSINPSRK